jgi:hypothetical protein
LGHHVERNKVTQPYCVTTAYGLVDGFTMAEKSVTENLKEDARYGMNAENLQQSRNL